MGIGKLTNPNFLIITTDEQRYPQHWPADWVANNLPSFARLANKGLTFNNAFTAACECSPSRASYLTSTYPQTNTVIGTPGTLPLPATLQNLSTILQTVNIPTFWKGKWHLSPAVNGGWFNWSEADIAHLASTYGMLSWNPPDAGTSISPSELSTLGGGHANNDRRYVTGESGTTTGWGTSAIDFIQNWSASNGPFCLVVSLVNPHDVFLYGGADAVENVKNAGYPVPECFQQGISLPGNSNDPLTTKPSVQKLYASSLPPLVGSSAESDYVNFYAYLHKESDRWIMRVLDALQHAGLTDNTIIIRYADHGEMALSHGLREKMYTAYEEAIHIPLIISNPTLWNSPQQSDAFVSLIDVVPTIAEIAGATLPSTAVGTSLTPIINGLSSQVHPFGVVYTYDDTAIDPSLADDLAQIRTLRQQFWKYSVYFNENAQPGVFQYELYDLGNDPGEMNNLAWGSNVPSGICQQWRALHATLTQQLKQMNALPSSWPEQTALPCTP